MKSSVNFFMRPIEDDPKSVAQNERDPKERRERISSFLFIDPEAQCEP